jgi:hypothetical protein
MSEPPDLASDTCRYIATVAIIEGIKTPFGLVAIMPGSVHCDHGYYQECQDAIESGCHYARKRALLKLHVADCGHQCWKRSRYSNTVDQIWYRDRITQTKLNNNLPQVRGSYTTTYDLYTIPSWSTTLQQVLQWVKSSGQTDDTGMLEFTKSQMLRVHELNRFRFRAETIYNKKRLKPQMKEQGNISRQIMKA